MMQKDLENVTCKEVSSLSHFEQMRSLLKSFGSDLVIVKKEMFKKNTNKKLHCLPFFLLDPNRAGNAHDMQPARVQGIH